MFSATCPICQKPKEAEMVIDGRPVFPICICPKAGDVMVRQRQLGLADKIRVTEVTAEKFVADVLEGPNTTDPLTVFRAGWHLYRKEN